MHLDTLYYLIELAETKSITQVARKINISPSAISQSVSQVEDKLGLKLFNRTPAGTYTTSEGERIIELARQVIKSYNSLLDQANSMQAGQDHPLKIGVSNEVPKFLLDLLMKFQEKHFSFKVELSEYQSKEIVDLIQAEKLDLGLVYVTPGHLQRMSDLHFDKLYEDEVKLFMSRNHYLADAEELDVELLCEQDFILFKDEYIMEIIREFQVKYRTINVMTTTSSVRVLLDMLNNLQGVSFIRSKQLKQNLLGLPEDNLITKDISNLISRSFSYGLVHRKNPLFTALEWEFMSEIRNHFLLSET